MAYSKRHARRRWLGHHELRRFVASIDAHETLAHAVKAAITFQVDLSELPLAVLQDFNLNIEKDVYQVLSLRGWLNARNNLGGTAPNQVWAQIVRNWARLG